MWCTVQCGERCGAVWLWCLRATSHNVEDQFASCLACFLPFPLLACAQARRQGQLNSAFVSAAAVGAAGGGYGSDEDVYRAAAAADAAAGVPAGGYDSDDTGALRRWNLAAVLCCWRPAASAHCPLAFLSHPCHHLQPPQQQPPRPAATRRLSRWRRCSTRASSTPSSTKSFTTRRRR